MNVQHETNSETITLTQSTLIEQIILYANFWPNTNPWELPVKVSQVLDKSLISPLSCSRWELLVCYWQIIFFGEKHTPWSGIQRQLDSLGLYAVTWLEPGIRVSFSHMLYYWTASHICSITGWGVHDYIVQTHKTWISVMLVECNYNRLDYIKPCTSGGTNCSACWASRKSKPIFRLAMLYRRFVSAIMFGNCSCNVWKILIHTRSDFQAETYRRNVCWERIEVRSDKRSIPSKKTPRVTQILGGMEKRDII